MEPRIFTRSKHNISRKNIDPDALKVLYRLYRAGHTAYLVGGGVRDLLLARKPKDFDIGTSARPSQVRKLFRNCWIIGKRFRLAHIHFQGAKVVEVSTFRSEPERDENGPQDELLVKHDNTFGSPEEDARRRDFTINGLFYDISTFSIIDYVGGMEDVESRVIRTIGDPDIRFREDPVRMIRAIKFAARLDFDIESDTWEALIRHRHEIVKSPPSRVIEEISRLLEGGAARRSFELLAETGFLPILLPTLSAYLHPDSEVWRRSLGQLEERVRRRWEASQQAEDGEAPPDSEPIEEDPWVVEPEWSPWRDEDPLWVMLGAADKLFPRSRAALYAAVVHPLIESSRPVVKLPDVERISQELLAGRFGSVITRKDREHIAQILQSHRRLLKKRRKGPVGGILRKPYFADALQFMEIATEATGEGEAEVRWWRERLEALHVAEHPRPSWEEDERLDSMEYRFFAAGPLDEDEAALVEPEMPEEDSLALPARLLRVEPPPEISPSRASAAVRPARRRVRSFRPGQRPPWAHLP
ncbi:MAG TPA: polynucleotide adenylyltransferase PcnB [Candidatus Xenobia bacterium]|jgi:poly(A) polymerase